MTLMTLMTSLPVCSSRLSPPGTPLDQKLSVDDVDDEVSHDVGKKLLICEDNYDDM